MSIIPKEEVRKVRHTVFPAGERQEVRPDQSVWETLG